MTTRPSILQLLDSQEYVASNCYQHQLFQTISRASTLTHVNLSDIKRSNQLKQVLDYSRWHRVISTLKLRTVYNNLDVLEEFLDDASVIIYDQDPWCSYTNDSPFKGAYEKIANRLNVKFFAVTTRWWAEFIQKQGLKAKFVPMCVLPEYCVNRSSWDEKTIEVGFKGQMHPHRQELVNKLQKLGVDVTVSPGSNMSYSDYLRFVSQMKIYLHSEDVTWFVNHEPVNAGHGLWIKDVEVAAQGTFTIRNYDDEYVHYVADIPTVKLYKSVEDIPEIVKEIQSLAPERRNELIQGSIETIKARNGWKQAVETMIYD